MACHWRPGLGSRFRPATWGEDEDAVGGGERPGVAAEGPDPALVRYRNDVVHVRQGERGSRRQAHPLTGHSGREGWLSLGGVDQHLAGALERERLWVVLGRLGRRL